MADRTVQIKKLEQFVRGQEFLRLGQTVTRGQWSAARMTMQRIGQTMERLRMQSMKKFLPQLQNTFARKNTAQAKNVLALMTQRRVQIIRILTEA